MSQHARHRCSSHCGELSSTLGARQSNSRSRGRLPMDHELFTEGNLRREVLAKQTPCRGHR